MIPIETEKIRRVVLVLQDDQAFVRLGIVGRPDAVLPLITQKVDVDPARREGLHRGPEVACPSDVLVGFMRVCPHRIDVQQKWRSAMDVGRLIVADAADGSLQDEDIEHGFPVKVGRHMQCGGRSSSARDQ